MSKLANIYIYIYSKSLPTLGLVSRAAPAALSSFIANGADLVSGLFCFDQLKICYQSAIGFFHLKNCQFVPKNINK